jgi:spore coat-associated protein N
MKKILGLTLAALVTIALIGGSTWAYFSDVESSTNNSLTAGVLDLNIDGDNEAVTTFSVTGKAPGDSGNGSSTLTNVGDFGGELDITFSTITNVAGTVGEYQGGADLGGVAEMAVYLDINQSASWDTGDIGLKSSDNSHFTNSGSIPLDWAVINDYGSKKFDAVETMAADAADDLVLEWRIPTEAGNSIQGDSVSCNVTITLEQAAVDS